MTKFKTLILILSLLRFLPVMSQKIVEIHEKSQKTANYSEIFTSAKLIKLETNKDCMIAEVAKVELDLNQIFIFDSKYDFIYIFSVKGKYIAKIGTKGKGPGELKSITYFSLDKEAKHVEVLDPTQGMFIFDYNGKYLKTHKSVYVWSFEKLNSSNYLGYSYNGPFFIGIQPINTSLAVFNTDGKLVQEFSGIVTIPKTINIVTNGNMFLDDDKGVFVVPIFERSLYCVNKMNNISKVCDFKFDTNIPKNFLSNSKDFPSAVQENVRYNYPFFITRISSVKGIINFSFTYDRHPFLAFWDQSNDSTLTINSSNFKNDLALVSVTGFEGAFNEGLIDVVDAVDFIDIYSNSIEKTGKLSTVLPEEMRQSMFKAFNITSPNDNPLLLFYSYK